MVIKYGILAPINQLQNIVAKVYNFIIINFQIVNNSWSCYRSKKANYSKEIAYWKRSSFRTIKKINNEIFTHNYFCFF